MKQNNRKFNNALYKFVGVLDKYASPKIIIWNLLLVRTHAPKVIFICCSHVNNLALHDVILADQWGDVLKVTTRYDRDPKIDFK